MIAQTAQRICQRINSAEVVLPGVWCAHMVRYGPYCYGCYGVMLIGRRAQQLATIMSVEHYQALANHTPAENPAKVVELEDRESRR